MSRLALGTVQFGLPYGVANHEGQVPRSTAKDMLKLAAENGVDTLDTAIAYGESEACLGEVGTAGFKVVTKLPALPRHCADVSAWVEKEVGLSLARLGVSDVYGLLLHRSDNLLREDGQVLYRALQSLKEAGYVQKIGISIYAPVELDALAFRYPLDLVQAPFNLVDRRLTTSGWLQKLKANGVEVHARSAFLQGLLLMRKADIPKKFAGWANVWSRWHEWLASHDVSAVQACLAYPLSFSEVDRVVVGADNLDQLAQISGAEASSVAMDLPDLSCEADNLINPSLWPHL